MRSSAWYKVTSLQGAKPRVLTQGVPCHGPTLMAGQMNDSAHILLRTWPSAQGLARASRLVESGNADRQADATYRPFPHHVLFVQLALIGGPHLRTIDRSIDRIGLRARIVRHKSDTSCRVLQETRIVPFAVPCRAHLGINMRIASC